MNEADQQQRKNRLAKIALGLAALGCLLTGFVLYLFAEQLGFDEETAQLMAIAFMGTAVIDYLVMRYWDRIAQSGDK